MVAVDISIVFVAAVFGLLMTILGIALNNWVMFVLSAIYGITVLGYFGSNFDSIVIGTFNISFYPVFTLAFLFLLIILPCMLLWRER